MLVLICGKMGAGKSTKAKEVSKESNTILLSEDEWLGKLYPGQISGLEDYIKYSRLIKPVVKSLVQDLLLSGVRVVMDFPANTVSQRVWLKSIASEISAEHKLLYLSASDSLCLDRIAKRRIEQPERQATDTEEMFRQVTKYFVEPCENEQLNVTVIECHA